MLTVATFNIKNNYNDYEYSKSLDIYNFVLKNNIDILCMQEVFSKCRNDLDKIISSTDYNLYGEYRYKMKIFNHISEAVSILTNKKLLSNKTIHLPYLPSLLKRVFTRIEISTSDFSKVVIYNTHLDYMFDIAKKRQLKKIIKYIKKESCPVIVTGDFNLKNNNDIYLEFVNNMKEIGLCEIEIDGKTLKQSRGRRAIDHIFISKDFKIIKKEIVKNLSISDHYPVLIELEKNSNI